MKSLLFVRSALWLALVLLTSLALQAAAYKKGGSRAGGGGGGGAAGGKANQAGGAQPVNQNPCANAAAAVVKFKELALNEEFYLATDTKKSFLKVKVSDTEVKTVATGEVLGSMPRETLVVKKGGAKTP